MPATCMTKTVAIMYTHCEEETLPLSLVYRLRYLGTSASESALLTCGRQIGTYTYVGESLCRRNGTSPGLVIEQQETVYVVGPVAVAAVLWFCISFL